ncbi:MAG: 3-keto-5-aminohexanoate cleavage protein [Betaproteobacteria bacterium]|nr:3-keto-5-aminohexanoate cleavage protein [Betaproteobacteria bacterium]
MDRLIITNCATDCSIYPEWRPRFDDSAVLASSIEAASRAGAAIAHIHAPPADYKAWESHTRAIRERCGIMIQYGISTQTVEQRRAVIKNHPDMISVAVGAHNLVFVGRDLQMLHPRAELAELMRMCRDHGVKPEFEVCALGDLWMIDDLASQGLVEPPFMMTLFFGRPGGTWSPPSAEEFLHRVKHLPKGTIYTASVTGATHLMLETMAVLSGGHVRVGTEDEPYFKPGVMGDNVDHVARIAAIAGHLGREVAAVEEARALLKLPRR